MINQSITQTCYGTSHSKFWHTRIYCRWNAV